MSYSQNVLPVLHALLTWLDGKKTYIVGAISLTVAFLGLKHIIDQETQAYLQALLALFAGGAELTTVKLGARMGKKD